MRKVAFFNINIVGDGLPGNTDNVPDIFHILARIYYIPGLALLPGKVKQSHETSSILPSLHLMVQIIFFILSSFCFNII